MKSKKRIDTIFKIQKVVTDNILIWDKLTGFEHKAPYSSDSPCSRCQFNKDGVVYLDACNYCIHNKDALIYDPYIRL